MDIAALLQAFFPVVGVLIPLALAYYILMAIALFSVSKRKGLPLSWLAWLPIGQDYVLGAIADDIGGSRFFSNGSYYRHILACIRIATIFYMGFTTIMIWRGTPLSIPYSSISFDLMSNTVIEVVPFAISVIKAAVIYKIFCYYRPERAVLYSLLCLFLSFLTPILLLTIRKSSHPRRRRPNNVDYFPSNRPQPNRNRDDVD